MQGEKNQIPNVREMMTNKINRTRIIPVLVKPPP